jgi:N-acetylmuramoyl-L-alanine amidase
MKVILDPGHGINTPGKRSPDSSLMEYEFNQDVAYKTKKLFEKSEKYKDIKIFITRAINERDVPLSKRCEFARNKGGDILISIHSNAYNPKLVIKKPDGSKKIIYQNKWNSANGFEIFYGYKKENLSLDLAKLMKKNMDPYNKKNNIRFRRFINNRKTNWYILNGVYVPSILVEFAFYTNKRECELLKTDKFRDSCASAISKTIIDFWLKNTKAKEK